MSQVNYILSQKAKTDERIINSTTLMRKSLIDYNKLLEFSKDMRDTFFDLYFKVKMAVDDKEKLPITDNQLRHFRTVDDKTKKSLLRELGEVDAEKKGLTESLHD